MWKRAKCSAACAAALDPTIVRLVWAALTPAGFSGLIAYIVAALIIPKDPELYR